MRSKCITITLIVLLALATGVVAAADDTTVIDGVNSSDIETASSFNVSVDTSEINSSSTLIESHDDANRTAVVAVEIGSNTINKSVDYGNQSEITVDYTTESQYPSDITNDSVNVTVDRSATQVSIDGSTIYPATLGGGGGIGGIDQQTLLIGVAVLLGLLLAKD